MKCSVSLNREGVRELLRSAEVQECLMQEAAARCPEGCALDAQVGTNRANVRIVTVTEEAYLDHLENNTLEKAIGG